MKKPSICAVIVNHDLDSIKEVEPLVDLFEVRIDLIGKDWQMVARQLKKPWIGCNRLAAEGGKWEQDEEPRIEELLKAVKMGAEIIDIELRTEGLEKVVPQLKKRAKCLISSHLEETPPLDEMKETIRRQLAAGADICKLVTTARNFNDSLLPLQLIKSFSEIRLVSFAMGQPGIVSRILSPLAGGDFTYASIERGAESAPGQITVRELRKIYEMIG